MNTTNFIATFFRSFNYAMELIKSRTKLQFPARLGETRSSRKCVASNLSLCNKAKSTRSKMQFIYIESEIFYLRTATICTCDVRLSENWIYQCSYNDFELTPFRDTTDAIFLSMTLIVRIVVSRLLIFLYQANVLVQPTVNTLLVREKAVQVKCHRMYRFK